MIIREFNIVKNVAELILQQGCYMLCMKDMMSHFL